MRYRHDSIAGADARRHKRETERICAAAHADAIVHSAKSGEITFKCFEYRPADESGGSQNGADRLQQFGFELQVRRDEIDKWDSVPFSHGCLRYLSTLAGLPATTAFGGTSFVTTLPAPTNAFSPIVTFDRIVAPDPIEAPLRTSVRSTVQSASVWS